MSRSVSIRILGLAVLALLALSDPALSQESRRLAGTAVTSQFEFVPGVNIEVEADGRKHNVVSDSEGRFSLNVPTGIVIVKISGKNIAPVTLLYGPTDNIADIQAKITYTIAPINESITIRDDALTPDIETRNDAVYKNDLFARDDQLLQTLGAGINAGQHEGGGKSLEVRRYGFNTDHGGVGGGVKIVVDNIQQNQGTQGHGQGYLGALKSLSPELVQDVSIINGPFSAAYGDFSGLGVVQIRQKESLPNSFTARVQGGVNNTFRGFFAYSPNWKNTDAFIAYEPSYTDGPFINPLKYRRDNLSGNFTHKFSEQQALGLKFNFGRNDFTSSGQIPLDLVASGELDRFGYIDPDNGGKVRIGTGAIYFRKELASGETIKADTYIGRSLFDLFSNFTFFAADPTFGDEIQQHDSRLQEAANFQYLKPYKAFGSYSLLTIGANVHANQVNVGLYPSVGRNPNRKFLPGNEANPDVLLTSAKANINNYAGYLQNAMSFLHGHLRIEMGLRYDYFSYDVNGFELGAVRTDLIGKQGKGEFQPKLSVAWSPWENTPISLYANYGRGISSQDARSVIREPNARMVSLTDFYQTGASYNGSRVSGVFSAFLIDRSNEQVYIPDDGSIELLGPTRSYGFEARTSVRLFKNLSLNAGATNVISAFYRGERTALGERVIVDSAPHLVANGGLVLAEFRGFNSSLTWRHISSYRLDPDDRTIRAGGNDVVDFAISKRLRKWVDLNFSIDNVLNKKYYETQNYFESRTCGTCDIASRIHATPGYPFTASVGLTFRFGIRK
ncbi:MAG: TonB-dependent receptor [Pyrinomonadaceae bacterium]|nr:TonB-dependent receptor [Pyrinomonadaceae bacterium]MBP6213492.1 TonB-dependent receptor [Pyrinomonadaceae bacterium]